MKRFFIIAFSLYLSGCVILNEERVPCPKAAILAEFSKSVDFHENTLIRTEMDSFRSSCTAEDNATLMNLRLRLTSFRPLSSFHSLQTLKVPFFIAIVESNGTLLSQSNQELEVLFKENQTTKVNFLNLQERIPAHKEVVVYAGFNLNEEQLNLLEKEREKKYLIKDFNSLH
ncbi:MAG: hypothetical protein KA112_03985 [Alphaproteobacteria bacterium]|jgi:hypothetical protein|nr:hypothetical protein [Alphaproteobacteria bacterium]MBP7729754.1 hypothetical protein [Alphaproteobacteria bacterium]